MGTDNDELLEVAKEIRELLSRIYVCFEDQYFEIQKKKAGEKLKALKAVLTTPERKRIYPLLFDPRNLSQAEIAKEAQVTRPAVTQFVSLLLEQGLIEQDKRNGRFIYYDKDGLAKLL